jgi:hypothetical protein
MRSFRPKTALFRLLIARGSDSTGYSHGKSGQRHKHLQQSTAGTQRTHVFIRNLCR